MLIDHFAPQENIWAALPPPPLVQAQASRGKGSAGQQREGK